jgi:hypothetical protein
MRVQVLISVLIIGFVFIWRLRYLLILIFSPLSVLFLKDFYQRRKFHPEKYPILPNYLPV